LVTTHELDNDLRRTIETEWNGPLITAERNLPPEDSWAPAWWTGDEDAARSNAMAAVVLDRKRRS